MLKKTLVERKKFQKGILPSMNKREERDMIKRDALL